MTGRANPRPPPSLLNPLTAREPELAARLAALRDHVCERLFDQLAAEAVKDVGFRAGARSHPPEDVRALALALRVLTKMQWDADDLRILDATLKPATRSGLFAESLEADRNRIEQLVATAKAGLPATSWAAKVAPAGGKPGKRPPPPRKAPSMPRPIAATASAAPPAPARIFTADAGDDIAVVLIEDAARGQLQIAFEQPSGTGQPSRAVQGFLRENGFEEDPAGNGSLWWRALNPASAFQDRIDGEWIVMQVADKMQTGKKARRG